MGERPAASLSGKDRLIVALDAPTHEEALTLVEKLENVSFFKVGLELFLAGNLLGFIKELQERRSGQGGVFVDLKLSGRHRQHDLQVHRGVYGLKRQVRYAHRVHALCDDNQDD